MTILKNEAETVQAGFEFAKNTLKKGDIVCLTGDLGAGKTTFTKGIAKALRSAFEPVSPTFNIVNIYPGDLPLYHFDLYRLQSTEDLYSVDFDSYTDGSGICVIEWPKIAYPLLEHYYEVNLSYYEDGRILQIKEVQP